MRILHLPAGGAVALFAAVVSVSGCATKGDIRSLRTEMQALTARQDSVLRELRNQQASTQDTLRTQTSRLFEIRGDLGNQLQRILEELTTLRELAGQNQRTIASVRDQLDALRRTGIATQAPAGGEAVVPDQGGATPTQPSGSAEDAYNAAVEQFNRGSLVAARFAFDQFLQQYPNHRLAPDASFYLADILVQEDKVDEAIAAFEEIPKRFPQADKVPDALYRIGLLQIRKGNKDQARRTLERVVNSYPDSGAAQLAKDRLKELH